ncbi:MAG: zinc ribbon domain-containing protein [Candidatus Bathyarchaeia archaeon]
MEGTALKSGIFLLILGFISIQFGLLMTLHQTTLVNYVSAILPETTSIELIGVLLQLLGVLLVTFGFVASVSSIVSIKLENKLHNLTAELLSKVEERRINITSLPTSLKVSSAPLKCKFCGTKLEKDDLFCTSCGKSQR